MHDHDTFILLFFFPFFASRPFSCFFIFLFAASRGAFTASTARAARRSSLAAVTPLRIRAYTSAKRVVPHLDCNSV